MCSSSSFRYVCCSSCFRCSGGSGKSPRTKTNTIYRVSPSTRKYTGKRHQFSTRRVNYGGNSASIILGKIWGLFEITRSRFLFLCFNFRGCGNKFARGIPKQYNPICTFTLTVYEPSQWVIGSQRTYAELFQLPPEKVRIITPFLGGGFGSKAFPWPHAILCASAARQLQLPLKVVLSRRQLTANAGHRSETKQMINLGANADGSLIVIDLTAISYTSPV